MNLPNSARHYADDLVWNWKSGTKIYRQRWMIRFVASLDELGLLDQFLSALKAHQETK